MRPFEGGGQQNFNFKNLRLPCLSAKIGANIKQRQV